MKPTEYYDDMYTIKGCYHWAKSVGLKVDKESHGVEITLPGNSRQKPTEWDVALVTDNLENDLDFINEMNRLRRWKETKQGGE